MDLPVGMPIKEGMDTRRVDFHKFFPTLREHKLTGYVALDLLTDNGIEEGTLLYRDGEIIAADYIYVAKGKETQGEPALKEFMNACMGNGRFDVYELDSNEVINTREKNSKSMLKYKPSDKEIFALLPDTFTERGLEEERIRITSETIKSAQGVSREEVLKKYGISHPDDRMLDTLLKGVMDESA